MQHPVTAIKLSRLITDCTRNVAEHFMQLCSEEWDMNDFPKIIVSGTRGVIVQFYLTSIRINSKFNTA
jgi:hypothetical protein